MQNIFFQLIKNLNPEFSHYVTLKLLKLNLFTGNNFNEPILHQHLFGFDFSNPLGLAAGFDKNAEVNQSMFSIGFGFVEVGTVTPLPQIGNPKPRIFRLEKDNAIINSLGFNNKGSKNVKKNISKLKKTFVENKIIGINLGKNKNSANSNDHY